MEATHLYHITYGAVILLGMLTQIGPNRAKVIRKSDKRVCIVDTTLLYKSPYIRLI